MNYHRFAQNIRPGTRTFVVWLALLVPLCSSAQAPTANQDPAPTAGLPSAKDVITRFVKEIGGSDAFDKITSQRMIGKFEMSGQGITGKLEVLAKRPDKLVIKISLPGIGDLLQGFDGKVGWSVNPVTGPMVLEGKMLDQVREQARFDAVLHKDAEFKSMQTIGNADFEGKQALQLKMLRKSGQETTEYYDPQTGLLVGSSEIQETPLGPISVTGAIGDYRKFGDILFATRLTQKMGPLAQVMRFETMEFNGVDDAAFELPPAIKALVGK
jgi:hypothetical protein